MIQQTRDIRDVLVEASELIEKPAPEVWGALRCIKGMLVPRTTFAGTRVAGNPKTADGGLLGKIAMDERVVEMDEPLMILRTEMTAGQNVPWTAYESRVRVAPIGNRSSQTTITCLVRPTSEPAAVEGMLRGLIVLSLQSLKRRLEKW
jgi:hypothetical protein